MFTKKESHSHSKSNLLKLLAKRSQCKRLSVKRGVYEQWPTQQKPSLFNCSTNYLKYLNSGKKQQKEKNIQQRPKSSTGFKKISATFSTCTMMEFHSASQSNIQVRKFIQTPKSQESSKQGLLVKKKQNSSYMTPQYDEKSQIRQQDNSVNDLPNKQKSIAKINSKYDDSLQKPFYRKASNHEKRLVKTAEINRKTIEIEDNHETESQNTIKLSNQKSAMEHLSRPKTANTTSSQIQNNQSIKNALGFKSLHLTSSISQQSIQQLCNYPRRLKDYETNFHAYKVLSALIDERMKWQPKKGRPKSSVSFKKCNVSLKA